jgi:CheY-like chemotaxis protein
LEHRELPSLRGCAILVVEDDAEASDLLRRLLELLGARVYVAGNGFDALDRLASLPVDVVLCDLAMPIMSGLEFARRVRRNPRFRRIPLVAVTGRREQDDFLQTWDAGFDAHLVKPVTVEMLQSLARRFSWRSGQTRSGT